jgi:putative ABC transport system permease protein
VRPFPARQAARLPIRQALGGRRPAQQPARIWLWIGLGMLGMGLSLLLLLPRTEPALTVLSLLGGSVLGVLGFGALCPWLLEGLARRAAALPLALRLAVRDAGRFRARNGPVVTAVLAGMATSVTVAALVASVESTIGALPARYRADQLWIEGPAAEELARRIGKELHAVAVAPLAAAYLQGQPVLARFDTTAAGRGPTAWVALGDEALLRAFGLEAAASDFEAGRLLAFDAPTAAAEAELTIGREARVVGRADVRGVASSERVDGPRFFLARASGAAEGLEAGPPPRKTLFPWIVRLDQPVTAEVLARAQALAAPETGTTVDAARLHLGPTRTLYHVLLGLCLLTGLVVVLLATALSAAESEEDVHTLHTVGAAPALILRNAARAGYLPSSVALAVPAGLSPRWAARRNEHRTQFRPAPARPADRVSAARAGRGHRVVRGRSVAWRRRRARSCSLAARPPSGVG